MLESYGPEITRQGSFAYNGLMAQWLVERGVRFVQCFHAGWDHHPYVFTIWMAGGGVRRGFSYSESDENLA